MDAAVSAGEAWRVQMSAEMVAAGMDAPTTIIGDGRLQRFAPDPGRGESGWYVVYTGDHFTSWAFGDWRAGIKHTGHTKPGKKLSPKEWRAHKKRLRERRVQVQAECLAIQQEAAIEAQHRWKALKPAHPSHPYLQKKQVQPCGARQDGNRLVLAMTSIHDGKIRSWREIEPDGFKRNQAGALQKGCYFKIGEFSDIFVICEGFATAATLAKIPWHKLPLFYTRRLDSPTILAAGDAGNLEEVARGVREKRRDAVIIIAADDDWLTKPHNTGLIKAEKAAKAVGGILVKPWFHSSSRPHDATDFNDQYIFGGGIDHVYDTFKVALIEYEELKAAEREAAAAAFASNDEPEETLPPVEFPSADETVEFSEDALSLALAKQHVDKWRHVQKWGWMHFRGGRRVQDESNVTLTYTRKVCRQAAIEADDKKLAAASTVAAVERLTRYDERFAMGTDEWDRDPWQLNTPDGTVDLRTGRMRAHRREDYITKVTSVSPANTGCPLFMEFIQKITKDNRDLVAFLQRSLGYSLTGITREHALFFWYGYGGNGKSVLLNTISGILGEYHTTAGMETFVETHGDRHPTELASLRGAHLVTAVETERGRNWAEAKIKALTGGDPISARFMRQDPFTFTPQFKLIIAGNHKPSLRSVDQAIRRRLHLVPFTVNIPKEQQDKDLAEKLKAEWPAILTWLIEGCLEWQRIGLAPPAVVADATDEYLASQDSITLWIEDRCIVDANAWTNVTVLFASYSDWAQKAGEQIGSQKQFKEALGKINLVTFGRTEKGSGYRGLKINSIRPADSTLPPVGSYQ